MAGEGDNHNKAGFEILKKRQGILGTKDQAHIGFSVLVA